MTEKEFVKIVDGQMVVDFKYEPPPPPEFRLYYDNNGNVLFYTGEKPEGNYIVIDTATFAAGRMDCKVIDGEIIYSSNITQIYKLKPNDKGTYTYKNDVALVIDKRSKVEGQYWDLSLLQLIKK